MVASLCCMCMSLLLKMFLQIYIHSTLPWEKSKEYHNLWSRSTGEEASRLRTDCPRAPYPALWPSRFWPMRGKFWECWPIRSQHYLATSSSSSSVQMSMNSSGRARSWAAMSGTPGVTSGVRPSPGASSEIAAWNNLEDWWDAEGKMHK